MDEQVCESFTCRAPPTQKVTTRMGDPNGEDVFGDPTGRLRRLSPAGLALQLAKESARTHELIVEDPACDLEQLADHGVADRVADREAFLPGRDDPLVAQHGQLLGDDGLVEGERLLELLHGTPSAHQDLEDANPGGMRERAEELRLEGLERPGGRRGAGGPIAPRPCHWTTIFKYCYDGKPVAGARRAAGVEGVPLS